MSEAVQKGGWRKAAMEWGLVALSTLIGFGLIEGGYRGYLYFRTVVQGDYGIVLVDHREPRISTNAPDDVFGFVPPTRYNQVYLNTRNEVIYEHLTLGNNLGWTSRNDYRVEREPGEFRVAVIGGSTTAAVDNEHAWTDTLGDLLNADRELLRALGAQRISVLNIASPGASIWNIADRTSKLARRFSPDFAILNFSLENVTTGVPFQIKPGFGSIPAATPIMPYDPSVRPDDAVTFENVEIRLLCGENKSLANPRCVVSPIWYAPPDANPDAVTIAAVKRRVASRRLLHTVLLAKSSLVLRDIMVGAGVTPAQADNADRSGAALDALRAVQTLHPRLLLTHNPHIWHEGATVAPVIDHLLTHLRRGGFEVRRMADEMPARLDSAEAKGWYMFNGHWNDPGAAIYASAMYRVVRERLLADRGVAPSREEQACAASLGHFTNGRSAAASGHRAMAAASLDAALAALPADAETRARAAGGRYSDCRFVGDLLAERAGLAAHGPQMEAADWERALRLSPEPAAVLKRRVVASLAAGRPEAAETDLAEIARLRPEDGEALLQLGDLQLGAQRAEPALASYLEARRRGRSGIDVTFRVAQVLSVLKAHDRVIAEATAGLELSPATASLLYLRGAAHQQLGRRRAALADYTAAANLEPTALYVASRDALTNAGG